MKNLTATLFAAAVMAGAAWGGPAVGRTLALDVTQPDNVWSTTVTRGEAFYIQANLYNRGAVYTNNDLTGYIWYASNATAAAGAILQSTSNAAGYVWFWMSTSNSLGLATNDNFPTSYFAQVVLTNATTKYDWRQGKFTVRDGGGLSGVGAATAFTTLNWDAINGIGTMPGSLSTANVQSIINAVAATGTYHNAEELGGLAASAHNTNNASQIDSGTLADARIASTIARDSEVDAHTQNVTTAHNVEARIAAATQTIAGASVSGTVPSATTAATATNAQQLGNVEASAFVTNNQPSVTHETIIASYLQRTGAPGFTVLDLFNYRLYGSIVASYFDWDDMIGTDDDGYTWIDGKNRQLRSGGGSPVLDWWGDATPSTASLWYNSVDTKWQFETRVFVTNYPITAFQGVEVHDDSSNPALWFRGTNWSDANRFWVRLYSLAGTNVWAFVGPDGTIFTVSELPDTFLGRTDFYGPLYTHGGGNVVTTGVKIAASTNADYAVSAGAATNLQTGTFSATMNGSAKTLVLGDSGDEAFFRFSLTNDTPRLFFAETEGLWWSLALDGGFANTLYLTNASGAYAYIFGSGGNVVTTGVKIAAATNADYAASAGTAATATGLVDNAVITVAPPTASNSPVDYATFSGALVGNFVSFLTTNRVNASTNASLPTVPSSSSITSVQVTAVGQYYLTWRATNRTFRQLQGGAAEVELWACENTAGSLTHKPEIYIYVTNTAQLIEFGENVASQTVAAGSTLTKQTFTIPYGPFVTNVDCQFVLRLKVTTLSGTPTVQIGCGGTTPSHFSIDVPNSSLVPDNAVNAYNLGNVAAESYPTNGAIGVTLTGTLTPTNSLTVTNALQLAGIPADRYPTNLAVDVLDSWHVASNVMSYSQSTLTVTRAMGEYISWRLTNNATLQIDRSTFPSNGAAFVHVSLYIGSYSLTFGTNSISTNAAAANPPGSGGVVLTNNAWNSVVLHNPYGNSNALWGVRQ